MKKAIIAATAILGLAGSTLFGQADVTEAAKAKYITVTQAKAYAVKAVSGQVVDIEFEKGKHPHYEIEIKNAKEEVELEVDAVTGKVKITDRDPIKQAAKKPAAQTQYITQAKAIQIAKAKIGGKGTVTDVELESDDGVRYYNIEIKHGKKEYEFEIHAVTGKILEFDVD